MADSKITALTAISTVDPAADVLPIVDVSDTSMAASGTTKKITSNQILGAGGTATLASATITGDLTVATDALKVVSASKRVLINQAAAIQGDSLEVTAKTNAGAISLFGRASDNLSILAFRANGAATQKAAVWGGDAGLQIVTGSTIAATFDASQNLGLGVTPTTIVGSSGSNGRGLQGDSWTISGYGNADGGAYLANNVYTSSFKTWSNRVNAASSVYLQQQGQHQWWLGAAQAAGVISLTQAMTLDASGNLLVGTTSGSYKLTVNGTGYFASTLTLDGATRLAAAGSNALNFNTNSVDRVTIDSSGNSIITTTATAPALGTARQMVFNLTSDTNLRISVRGADGTTRTANITLA